MRSQQILIVLLLVGSKCLAGTNGILEGTVKDKATGELLPGVNVLIVGTQQGASTGDDGKYVVQNLRAGTYEELYLRYFPMGLF